MIIAIVNPAACQQRGTEIANALLTAAPRLRLVMSDQPADVDTVVAMASAAPPELLIVVGGDGTLLNLLTRFERAGAWDAVPPVLVLPAGHINTTARALVGARKPAALADRILRAWGRGVRRLRRVPVQRVEIDGEIARVGITVSVGAAARTHEDYDRALRPGPLGVAEVLARFAVQQLPRSRFRSLGDRVTLDGSPVPLPRVTGGVLSPLPGFFIGVRPFRGVRAVSAEGIHVALSGMGAKATQASLPAIIRGRRPPGANLYFGCHHEMAWTTGVSPDVLAIDGEVVPLAPRSRVRVAQHGYVRLLVWRSMPLSSSEPTA